MKKVLSSILLLVCSSKLFGFGINNFSCCKPLKGGSINVLFISLCSSQRDAVELCQRLDINANIIAVGTTTPKTPFAMPVYYWASCEKTEDEILNNIREELRKEYEVIILGSYPAWSNYPADIQKTILEKVISGTTLFVFSPDKNFLEELKKEDIKEIPLKDDIFLPLDGEDNTLKIYQHGSGKIATMNTTVNSNIGYLVSSSSDQASFEYRIQKLSHLIYRLVRNSVPAINKIETKKDTNISVISLNPSSNTYQMLITLRNKDYEVEKTFSLLSVKPHKDISHVPISLPVLSNGRHFLEILVYEKDNVIDWVSTYFDIENKVGIEKISLNKDELSIGEDLILQIKYYGNLNSSNIRLTFQDTWNRIFYQKEFTSLPEEIKINVPVGSLSILNFINVELFQNGKLVDVKKTEFTLPKNYDKKDFYLFLWNTGVGDTWRHRMYFDMVRRYGVDGFSNMSIYRPAARSCSLSNLLTVPYATVFAGTILPNLFNQEWINKTEGRAKQAAESHRPYGGFAYTLGDETNISPFKPEGRFWDSEVVWKEFRDYLKKIYPTIKELNQQWESNYSDWEEISFRKERDMLQDMNNPSAWVDFHMFLTTKFINVQKQMRDIIKEIDPDTYVGWDGTEQFSSYDGYDWWQYTQGFNFNNLYVRYLIPSGYPNKVFNGHCVRSFTEQENIRSCYMNSIDPIWGVHYAPWYMLFSGFNGAWWWTGTFLGYEVGAFDWFYQPTPIFGEIGKEVTEIKEGPATLIRNSTPVIQPIAIHYSENNWYASDLSSGIGNHINALGLQYDMWFAKDLVTRYVKNDEEFNGLWKGIKSIGHYVSSSKNFINLIQDLGLTFNMVARQQIEEGVLDNYKVLILPFVESLSEKEIIAIKDFVQKGGLLITDYHCGIRDIHGKILNEGTLDDVFGIKQKKPYYVEKEKNEVRIDGSGYVRAEYFFAKFNSIFYQPDIEITTGKALGCNEYGIPAFIINNYGKGATLYCNFDISSYFDLRRKGKENELRELFGKVLVRMGHISLSHRPYFENNSPIGQTQVFQFNDGQNTYLGVIRDFCSEDLSSWKVIIPFCKKGHIYDVREKKYIGYEENVKTTLDAGYAKLYACLPYKVKTIKVKGEKKLKRGEPQYIKMEIVPEGNHGLSNHVVNVEVKEPNGSERFYMEKNVYLKDGKGEYSIPIALNDPIGEWIITIEEVVSGEKTDFKFNVQ